MSFLKILRGNYSFTNHIYILLYTLPVNSTGYVPFLINTLDTIVRVGYFC